MITRWRGRTHAGIRCLIPALVLAVLAGCAPVPASDPMQTIRDHQFYDGLIAFQDGDYKEAAARWERAAHYGDGDAARNLGHLYRQGLGVPQDLTVAVTWYQVAADAGVASANYNLGMLYLDGGPDFAANRALARVWLTKAADAGVAPARRELDRLAAETLLPPAPQSAAQSAPTTVVAVPEPEPEPAPAPAPTERVQVGSYQTLKAAKADLQRFKRRSGLEFGIIAGRFPDGAPGYRLMVQGPQQEVEAYCRQAAARCWPHKSKVL